MDFTVFPARCNMGNAYYDTKVGIKHQSLKTDLLRDIITACHRRNIRISVYMNLGLSHEEGLRHREWTTVSPDGYAYQPPLEDHFFRKMCYNTGYAQHVLEMIEELFDYDIDGFFFDCFAPHECIGVECIREQKARHMTVKEFARFSQQRFMHAIADKIRARGNYLLYFNGVPFYRQLDCATYLEYECLPTGGWGYESLQMNARLLRTFGKPLLSMTGRFHESWGDFGGIRSRESLLYDCITGLANTLPPSIGDHYHPRGDRNEEVLKLIASVYDELERLRECSRDSVALTDIIFIIPHIVMDNTIEGTNRIYGANSFSRLLCELHCQFDVQSPEQDFSRAKLLIFADDVTFDDSLANRVMDFLEKGGHAITCGFGGCTPDRKAFALPDYYPATVKGESPHDPAYLSLTDPAWYPDFPNMPLTLYEKGISMVADESTQERARIIAPYFNRGFDGEHSYLYLPPDKETGECALLANHQVAHFSHPIGWSYYNHAQPQLRNLMGKLIRDFVPEPVLHVRNLPTFARATVTQNSAGYTVWLTAYIPERRGARIDALEDSILLENLDITLTCPCKHILEVIEQKTGERLDYDILEGQHVSIRLPRFKGYCAILVRTQKTTTP